MAVSRKTKFSEDFMELSDQYQGFLNFRVGPLVARAAAMDIGFLILPVVTDFAAYVRFASAVAGRPGNRPFCLRSAASEHD
jgi:hypothetical protein